MPRGNLPEDYRRHVTAALAALNVRNLVLSIHDPSFPSAPGEDTGRGSPYSEGGMGFLEFARELGFNGIQLGPQGQTSEDNPSPYDGTLFSRNVLNVALGELTRVRARDDDVVRRVRQPLGLRPERLAQAALDARAVDRPADLPGHGQAEPRAVRGSRLGRAGVLLLGTGEGVEDEEPVALRAALAVDALELGAARQPASLRSH